jgi:uncharacterized coiled-coil DUF342 family protein
MNEPSIVQHLKRQQEGMLRRGEFAFINKNEIGELMTFIDALREERDEARQEVCRMATAHHGDPQAIACERGWSCFKGEA